MQVKRPAIGGGRLVIHSPETELPMKNDIPAHLRHGADRVAQDLHRLVDDAQALLRQSAHDVHDGAAEARARLEEGIVAAQAQLKALGARAARGTAAAGRYAGEHPLHLVGAGLAIGALIALVVMASRRD